MAGKTKAQQEAEDMAAAMDADNKAVVALAGSAQGIDFTPDTWEEIAEAFGGEVIVFEGSPYKVVDKKALVGVPFMIADIRLYEGKWGVAAAVCALTKDNDRVVFNDGSTGVYEQVKYFLTAKKRKAGILCPEGLRASNYEKEVRDGMTDEITMIPATTYYIA